MALALYRKYRPRTFAEVIGQDHVTEPLSQALRSGRLNHAYLFSGPRGCGKTSSARILARSLNCERGPTPEPCGVCDSCRALAPDGSGSIDVIEIDAASHGGVDDARELRERAFFAPAASRFKIYVIDEAHMVSTQGFNALLKLVEEPPDYVKFIFATTEPDKVLGTIKSRTHHYPFRLIPPGILRPYLEQLANAENAKVDPAVFPLIVRAGGGSARDSLSVLDQLIAGAGPEGVTYPRAVALLGVTDAALIDEMCDALAAGDGAAAYATIDRVAEAGHDPRRFASDLLERLRDLIVMQQVPEAAAKGLIEGPADQLERMSAQTQRLGPATLSRSADIVHNGLIEMRGTTAPRLLLELITARMLLPTADKGESGLLQRVERMERRLSLAGDQDFEPGEPADDYSGPAVLAGRGSASGARSTGAAEQRPAADASHRPAGGFESAGGAGSRPAGGGAAAARAAAAAAASRAGGARRGDLGSADNAAGNGGDALSAGRGGDARRADVVPAGDAAGGDPVSAGLGGGAGHADVVLAGDAAGGDPVSAGRGGDARRTHVVPADDAAGNDSDPLSLESPIGGARRDDAAGSDNVVGGDSDRVAAADGGRRDDIADDGQPSAAPGAGVGPAAGAGSPVEDRDRAGSPARSNGRAVDEPVAATGNDDSDGRPPRRVPPQAVMADPATPDPVIPEASAPGELDAAGVRRVWDEIVAMVRVSNKKIAALASEATVRDIDGDTLVLTFRHAFHARTLAENPEAVVDAIYEVLGGRWQIRCELAGDQRGAAGPPPARPAATREPSGTASAASASPPGRERGGREHSSSGQGGESGASGDRSDEDHQAARSAATAGHAIQADDQPGTNAGDDHAGVDPRRSGRPAQDADAPAAQGAFAGERVAPAESGVSRANVGDETDPPWDDTDPPWDDTDHATERRPGDADDRGPNETRSAGDGSEPHGAGAGGDRRPGGRSGQRVASTDHSEATPRGQAADEQDPRRAGNISAQRPGQDPAAGNEQVHPPETGHGASDENGRRASDGNGGRASDGNGGRASDGNGGRASDGSGGGASDGSGRGASYGNAARTSGREAPDTQRGSGRPSTANGPDRRDIATPADDEDDWPETALPGGQSADTGDGDWPETATPTFAVPQARNEHAESPSPVVAATATATISAAVTATKPARSAPGSVGAAAAARAAARAAAGGRAKPAAPQADVEFAGEPPFDPDYDGPAKGAERKAKFEGFDPGDEPTDEVIDERTARQSSEQQAFALLHEALGAERIGEIDLK